jgi:CHAD domain-containing protein
MVGHMAEHRAGQTAGTSALLREHVVVQRADLEASLGRLDDVESVHRVRTRARRIRSVLLAYSSETPHATRLCRNLRWLGLTVGRVRDLDVIGERLVGLDLVPELLERERAAAVEEVRTALGRPRARHLHRDLARLVEPERWSGLTQAPLAEVAPRVLAAERHRVLRRDLVAEHAEADRGARLHDVRKAAKRLRYAAEVAGASVLAAHAEELQTLLGAGNDALMTAAWLDRIARELPAEAERFRVESARQWADARLDDGAYTCAIEALRNTEL